MISNALLVPVLGTLLTAIVAAISGFWLAKIRFKHDQLWQEKNVVYKRVLGAVEAIRFWGEEVSSEAHFLPTVDWFDGKPAHQFYAEALREVSKQAVVGKMILSSEFVDALNELMIEIFRESHEAMEERRGDPSFDSIAFGAHAAAIRGLVDARFPELIRLARKDLGA